MIFLCSDGHTSIVSAMKIASALTQRHYIVAAKSELSSVENIILDQQIRAKFIQLPFLGFAPSGNGRSRCIYNIIFAFLGFFAIFIKVPFNERKSGISVSDKRKCTTSLYFYSLLFKNLTLFSHNEFGQSETISFKGLSYFRYTFTKSNDTTFKQLPTSGKYTGVKRIVLLPKFTVSERFTLDLINEFVEFCSQIDLPIYVSLHPKIRGIKDTLQNDPRIGLVTVGFASELAQGSGVAIIWHGTSVEFFADNRWQKYIYWNDFYLANSPDGNRYSGIPLIESVRELADILKLEKQK